MNKEQKFKEKIDSFASIIAEAQFDIGKSRKRPEPTPFKSIKYSGMKLSPGMEKQAMDVVSSISADAKDEVTAVSLTKKRVGGSTSRTVSIIFKVDFKQMESFVGVVEIPESDLYKNSPDPDEPGSISLKPGANLPAVDQYGNVIRDKKGNIYKAATGPSTGYAPVSPSSKSSDPRKMFSYLKEMVKDTPKITAMFVNPSGKSRNLADANFISAQTKNAIMKFLDGLSTDELKEEEIDKKETMKNKKDFKEKISEIAARIAEGAYGEEDVTEAEAQIPDGILTQYNSEVINGGTLAKVILRVIKQIIDKEPSLQNLEKMTGWSVIMPKLNDLADSAQKKPAAGEAPPASDKMDLPDLKEAFNRINRK